MGTNFQLIHTKNKISLVNFNLRSFSKRYDYKTVMHGNRTQNTEARTNITIFKQMMVMYMENKSLPSKEARERRTRV